MVDRRYYAMMGMIAAIFCAGSLLIGVMDARNVVHHIAAMQTQERTTLQDQLEQEAAPGTTDEVVTAGY